MFLSGWVNRREGGINIPPSHSLIYSLLADNRQQHLWRPEKTTQQNRCTLMGGDRQENDSADLHQDTRPENGGRRVWIVACRPTRHAQFPLTLTHTHTLVSLTLTPTLILTPFSPSTDSFSLSPFSISPLSRLLPAHAVGNFHPHPPSCRNHLSSSSSSSFVSSSTSHTF